MRRFRCEGPVPVTLQTWAESPELAAELFRQEHGVLPQYVDLMLVTGRCSACGVVLFARTESRGMNNAPSCRECAMAEKSWDLLKVD